MTETAVDGGSTRAEFAHLQNQPVAAGGDAEINIDSILDVKLVLTLEVGRTRISVRELLSLTPGSVV